MIHALGQFDISLGDTSRVVCGQCDRDLVVGNQHVWVMLRLFRNLGEIVDKVDGIIEFLEFDRSGNGVALRLPFRAFLQGVFEFFSIKEIGHGSGGDLPKSELRESAVASLILASLYFFKPGVVKAQKLP